MSKSKGHTIIRWCTIKAKHQRTNFGRLLTTYRHKKGVNKTELHTLLRDNGFEISFSMVGKYENGDRRPSAEFIYYVVKSMDLTEAEKGALIDAYILDFHLEFFNIYEQTAVNDKRKSRNTKRD